MLSCSFRGNPEIVVQWLKNGNGFSPTEKVKSVPEPKPQPFVVEHRLEFTAVSRDDNGTYSCQGSNVKGASVGVRDLIVLGKYF